MNDQKDQSAMDIVIVGVVFVALILISQLSAVQLIILNAEARIDARIAALCGDDAAAKNLRTLVGWLGAADRDKELRIDVQGAKQFHRDNLTRVSRCKFAAVVVVSSLLAVAMLFKLFQDWKKNQVTQDAPSKSGPMGNARALLLRKAPGKFREEISKAKNAEELFAVYERIRFEKNIPNNLVARYWPYGSKERHMFLDCLRDLSISSERK